MLKPALWICLTLAVALQAPGANMLVNGVTMSGIVSVPYGAASVLIKLQQAERKNLPQTGSAARFSDLRLVLFPTEAAPRAYVEEYK